MARMLALTVASGAAAGCATGSITLGEPRVYRDNRVMESTSEQLRYLDEKVKSLDVTGLQGERARASSASIEYTGATQGEADIESVAAALRELLGLEGGGEEQETSAPVPTPELPAPLGVRGRAASVNLALSARTPVEDPVSALQRWNDVSYAIQDRRLEHLRDSLASQPGTSLFLVSLDVSVLPGPAVEREHSGIIRARILPRRDRTPAAGRGCRRAEDRNQAEDEKTRSGNGVCAERPQKVRVYAALPRQYADRFAELGELYQSLQTASGLEGGIRLGPIQIGTSQRVRTAREFSEAVSYLQRYPRIAGFVSSDDEFGWIFNPSPQLRTTGWGWWRGLTFTRRMERATHTVNLLLAVEDDRVELPRGIAGLELHEICRAYQGSYGWLRGRLQGVLDDALKWESPDGNRDPGTLEDRRLAEGWGAFFSEPSAEVSARQKGQGQAQADPSSKPELRCERLDPEEQVEEKPRLNADEQLFRDFVKAVFGLNNRRREGAIPEVEVQITGGSWAPLSGCALRWVCQRAFDRTFAASLPTGFKIRLPGSIDRTLMHVDGIFPSRGPGNLQNVVRIRGTNFGSGARVFVCGKEAGGVEVLSRQLLMAKLPAMELRATNPAKGQGGSAPERSGKCDIVVVTGGDGMGYTDAFQFEEPFAGKPAPKLVFELGEDQRKGTEGTQIALVANQTIPKSKVKKVTFGDAEVTAPIRNLDAKTLIVTVPAGKSGAKVFVTVHVQDGAQLTEVILSSQFEYSSADRSGQQGMRPGPSQ